MSDLREQHELWLKDQQARQEPNPCVRMYGPDPKGRECRQCRHLEARLRSKVYWKCRLRKETRGAGSDHRVRWKACARFEEQRG